MMIRRTSPAVLLLPLVLSLGACKPPKEVPYDKLEYQSQGVQGIFKDKETGKGFTGVSKNVDKNGKLIGEFHFKDGFLHGMVTEWYPNGKKKSETEFKNGSRTGKNIEWTEAGLIYQERVYDNDRIVSEKTHEAGK